MQQWMSLDGYIAGPKGELDFFTNYTNNDDKYSDRDQLKMLEEKIDLIILGRNTYKLFVEFWPSEMSKSEVISERLNGTKKIIFSNSLKQAPWGGWPAAEVAPGDAVDNVRKLKSSPGKDIILWGSISLSQSLMHANLVDEYHIQLCPVILGAGRPLFLQGSEFRNLTLTSSKKYESGVVHLQYVR
jgi:dihydrofolate reductase